MGILEKMRLDGKSIFVTGGARGIGMNYAKAVAEAGADVAIVDMDLETAERTAATLAAETGRRFLAIRCDVTDEESVHAMMDTFLAAFGKLDAAFCNAGICTNVPAEEMSYACWKKVIDVNLNGMFLTNQAAGRQMLKQGYGSIINTASMQLLPTTVAAVRAGLGCRTPYDILPAVWLSSAVSVTAGVLAARFFRGGKL